MNEETIFAAAAKKTPQERAAYLDEACQGNAELRAQVEELLAASNAAGSFFEHPPAALDATVDAAEHDTHKPAGWDGSLAFLKPTDNPGRIGKLVGNAGEYEIIEVVGSGGMGIVLRAFDTKLSRVVAVKVLAPELARNPTAVKRFLREAKAAAAVVHDHVVTIHNVEESHQPPFLVMQYIDGQTLQQKIDRTGALELKEILRIGCQAAAGLAAAHKHGLVHRDVKPANILLENGIERVKITDFGLARAADDVEITQTGLIAGTPQYMSPEQARGETVDARSDLFSLGSVLYTMCTGRPAFRAETTMGVIRRVCDDEPRPIREVNADIPTWLDQIVCRLLAKNPDDRYQTAGEVSDLLSQCLAHVQDPAHVFPPPTFATGSLRQPPALSPEPPPVRQPGKPAAPARRPSLVLALSLMLAPLLLFSAAWIVWIASGKGPRWILPMGAIQAVLSILIGLILLVVRLAAPPQAKVSDAGAGRSSQWSAGAVILAILAMVIGVPVAIASLLVLGYWLMPIGGVPAKQPLGDRGGMHLDDGSDVTLPSEDRPELTAGEWTPLFNGRDFDGWVHVKREKDPHLANVWKIDNGVLSAVGGPGNSGSLRSAKRYANYTLQLKFRFPPQAAGDAPIVTDTGLVLHRRDADAGFPPSGFKFTLGRAGFGDLLHVDTMDRCRATVNRHPISFSPAGEWNDLTIWSRSGTLEASVNGRLAALLSNCAPNRGYIAFDAHGTPIEFRDILIREELSTMPDEDWTPLFNGKNLSGWKTLPDQPGLWQVRDEVLIGSTKPGYLFTERGDFANFHLRAEVKINGRGDAGIFFRSPFAFRRGKQTWMIQPASGYELELYNLPAPTGSIWEIVGAKPPSLLCSARHDSYIRPDEWFTVEVLADGNRLVTRVNGRETVDQIDQKNQFADGHIVLAVTSPETVVQFRKIEIRELAAARDPRSSLWGETYDGCQFGVGFKDGKLRYAAGEKVELELKIRNTTDAEQTIEIRRPQEAYVGYEGEMELAVRVLGGERQKLTLAPRQEWIIPITPDPSGQSAAPLSQDEKDLAVPRPTIKTAALAKGYYRVRLVALLAGTKQELADEGFGFHLDGPEPQPFDPAGAASKEPLAHRDHPDVAWGNPVLGLSLGIGPAHEPKDGTCSVYLWNTTAAPIDVRHIAPHPLDWQLVARDAQGRDLRSVGILSGPKMLTRSRLESGQAVALGSATLDRQFTVDSVPRDKLSPGSYKVSTNFDCRRLDVGHFHLRLNSGEASIEVP